MAVARAVYATLSCKEEEEAAAAALGAGQPLPDKAIGITIDDAAKSVFHAAWPRLREAGFPFTLFVSTDAVDQRRSSSMSWDEIIEFSHRRIDQLPEGMDPGLASFDIMQVPTGGNLPKDDKVHMYPCYSFEFHLVLDL